MIDLNKELFKYFGHTGFRQSQHEIITSILEGEQVIAILPTGAGKSLCYQLPALISDNFSIVISPLIALMKDQVDNLNKNSEIAGLINSTMDYSEIENVLQKLSYGKIKLLYVAPERLDSKSFAERISNLHPNFLFVDEAHCISEWGHNFRPSYTKISEFKDFCSIKKIAAFTATATPEVLKDIINLLQFSKPKLFVSGFERDNLCLNVHIDVNKINKTLELLSVNKGSAIVYTSSRKKAEELSDFLSLKNISSGAYHAGINSTIRRHIQDDFINDRLRVICATNAFGMGIDKKDIRLIIHYNLPGSVENYYQEIGRAGRDGKDAQIHLLYDDKDINIQNYFISNSHPTKELIQNIYAAICDFNSVALSSLPEKELIIDDSYINKYTGSTITKGLLHSALKFLENSGYLKIISELEKKDTIQITLSKKKIEEFVRRTRFNELKNTLLIILREFGSQLFIKQKDISLERLSRLINTSEEILHNSLITLDNLGIISFNPSLKEDSILLTSPRIEKEKLQLNYKKINESYLHSRKKLDKMTGYVFTSDCRFKYILGYFGEKVENYKCGKCDCCITGSRISDSTVEYLSEIILNTLAEAEKPFPENSLIGIIRGDTEKPSFASFKYFGAASNYEKSELKLIIQSLVSRNLISFSETKQKYLALSNIAKEQYPSENKENDNSNNYEIDLQLYHQLRNLRKEASEKFLQTPYLLCPDNVLSKVAKGKPKTRAELLSIEGFNTRMFNKIGYDFLEAIKKYSNVHEPVKRKTGIPQNIKGTYELMLKKYSLSEIAELRKLSEAVISMQIETIIESYPQSEIDYLFGTEIIEKIKREIEKGYTTLKEIKGRLPAKITYSQIRIVAAKYKSTLRS